MPAPSVEILNPAECLELLSGVPVGRIAITVEALPVILPVNFAVIGGDIFFRTDRGTKLAAATSRAVVAFEVDSHGADGRSGWSVMAQGMAREVTDPPTLEKIRNSGIRAWAVGGQAEHAVCIEVRQLSGRRFSTSCPPRS